MNSDGLLLDEMKNLEGLFVQQSYLDSLRGYRCALDDVCFPRWDAVILTASSSQQAELYKRQLKDRQLPPKTHFEIIADKDNERVGSGGATLQAVKWAQRKFKSFKGKRILLIHSGGDAKRSPCYSTIGKIFSPVPHSIEGRSLTLFDEIMISSSLVPSRIKDGMLVLSGDVLLLFNPLQIDFTDGAAAISFKECAAVGSNHGVFLRGKSGLVRKFLHKHSIEKLTMEGAVDNSGNVDIDTGAILLGSSILQSMCALVANEQDEKRFINSTARLSLYGDFIYPLAEDSTLEGYYRENSEGAIGEKLFDVRKKIWETLRPYRLKLLNLAPAKFLHFGTTHELLTLFTQGSKTFKTLGWSNNVNSCLKKRNASGYNSVCELKTKIGSGVYLEDTCVYDGGDIGNGAIVSCLDIRGSTKVPPGVVLHGIKRKDGRYVTQIFGVDDNPKENILFGKTLTNFLRQFNIHDCNSLWMDKIYPVCNDMQESIVAALNLYSLFFGAGGDAEAYCKAEKCSLASAAVDADVDALSDRQRRIHELVCVERILDAAKTESRASKYFGALHGVSLSEIQEALIEDKIASMTVEHKIRALFYVGMASGQEKYTKRAFSVISKCILIDFFKRYSHRKCFNICHDKSVVRLPLRVNWAGGWSDTPPYCNERGGHVLNASISLHGVLPVEVILKKRNDFKIVFDSRDMDANGEFISVDSLQETGDPYDPFALQKSVLLACGIIPLSGGSLEEILNRIGGGFEIISEVHGVPKGSGLGTSSILAAATIKGIFDFFGIKYTNDDIYDHVLAVEQIMSTGGGWQDQVGGLIPGIKFISSKPGVRQELRVECVDLPNETKKELNERFCLIYTGQRRLARHLLRDVVGKYLGNERGNARHMEMIQDLAFQMRSALERGDMDCFSQLLNQHWELSKLIDKESTNTLIDQIFLSIDDLIDGRFICGAGGGGFLQVILKKGVEKEEVDRRLKGLFRDSGIRVYESELLFDY